MEGNGGGRINMSVERIVDWILLAYGVIFLLPKFIRWLFFKKYTDDSFYPREDTPKGPIDYL